MGWFSQGYPGHTKLILISLFASQLFANYIVVQRWILPRDIIKELPLRTITSCMMECEGTDKCKTVGFLKDPEGLLNNTKHDKKCLLLKMLRKKNKLGTRTKVYALLDEETGANEETNATITLIEKQKCALDVNGGYSEWSKFTVCSKSCGTGAQYRNRTCDHPTPKFGGRNCSILGNNTEVRSCNEHQCPIDGGYGQWSNYGTCSKTCGAGKQQRSRVCDSPPPMYGGKDCTSLGQSTEQTSCSTIQCPPVKNMAYKKPCIQSSTYPSSRSINNALYANDGDLSTRSVTKETGYSWWQVDLQKLIQIDRIQLHLDDWALKRGYYGDVFIKTRKEKSNSFVLCANLGVPTILSNTLTCSSTTTARYVRVYNNHGNNYYLALSEVEVYGFEKTK